MIPPICRDCGRAALSPAAARIARANWTASGPGKPTATSGFSPSRKARTTPSSIVPTLAEHFPNRESRNSTNAGCVMHFSWLAPHEESRRKAFQNLRCFAEPRPLAPFLVRGHGRFSCQHSLRDVTRLRVASLCGKKSGVVDVGFRERRGHQNFAKQRIRFLGPSGIGIRVRQQRRRTLKIVFAVLVDHPFQIRHGSGEVAELQRTLTAAVKRIWRIRSNRNRLVVTLARLGVLAFILIESGEFFVVPCRRIVQNQRPQFANPPTTRERLKRSLHQAKIRNHLDANVNQRPQPPRNDDDVQPVGIRAPANEMQDGHALQQHAPPGKPVNEHWNHARSAQYIMGVANWNVTFGWGWECFSLPREGYRTEALPITPCGSC